MAGGITLFFSALGNIPGGWSALVAASPERMHLYQPPGHPMAPSRGIIIATFGAFTFYQVGNQSMIQRSALAARSTWDAMMGLVLASFINFFRPVVTCFLGLVVYHWIVVMHQAPPPADKRPGVHFARELCAVVGSTGHRAGRAVGRHHGHAQRVGEFDLDPLFRRHLQEVDPPRRHRPRDGARGAAGIPCRPADGRRLLANRRDDWAASSPSSRTPSPMSPAPSWRLC